MSKKTVAFVPMKLNNQRLPGKNTKAFKNGKPLLTYILSALSKCTEADEIYVYCSNEDVKEYLPANVKYLKRSEELDKNSTLILEVLKAFAADVDADVYTLAHATAPFIRPQTIDTAIRKVRDEGYDSAFTAKKVQEFLWTNGKPNYDTKKIPRTQDLTSTYAETTGLYVYTKDLINNGRRIGDNPYILEVDFIEATDINEPIDFDIAQVVLDKYINSADENE